MIFNSKTLEIVVFQINLILVISIIAISSDNLSRSGCKEGLIYFSWSISILYLISLGIALYQSNIKAKRKATKYFKIISLIPALYITPFSISIIINDFHIFFNILLLFSAIWHLLTLINLVSKNTHSK